MKTGGNDVQVMKTGGNDVQFIRLGCVTKILACTTNCMLSNKVKNINARISRREDLRKLKKLKVNEYRTLSYILITYSFIG